MKAFPEYAMTNDQLKSLWKSLQEAGFIVQPVSSPDGRQLFDKLIRIGTRENLKHPDGGCLVIKDGDVIFVAVDLARVNAASLPPDHFEVEIPPLPFRWRQKPKVLALLNEVEENIFKAGGRLWH